MWTAIVSPSATGLTRRTATSATSAAVTATRRIASLWMRARRGLRRLGARVAHVGIGIVTGSTGFGARRMASTTAVTAATATTAAMLGPSARILVWCVLTGLATFGARRVRAFLHLELRRGRELHRALEQLLDVPEQRHLVGRYQ